MSPAPSRRMILQGAVASTLTLPALLPAGASAASAVDPLVALKAERERRWKAHAAVQNEADRSWFAMPEDLRRDPVAQLPPYQLRSGEWRHPKPLRFEMEEAIAKFCEGSSMGGWIAESRSADRLAALWRADRDRIKEGRAALGWTALNGRAEALFDAAIEIEDEIRETVPVTMEGVIVQLGLVRERLALEPDGELVEMIIDRLREMGGAA